jgi:hypothetical protein
VGSPQDWEEVEAVVFRSVLDPARANAVVVLVLARDQGLVPVLPQVVGLEVERDGSGR